MRLLKSILSSIFVTLMVTQCAGTAQASGAVTGATEFTQIMNNSELIASVSQQAGINSTVLQQYITQLQQLQIQQQNIKGLANFNVQAELTRLAKEEARYTLAKKKSEDLSKSAKKTSDLMSADLQVMRDKGMSPSDYYGNAAKAAAEGSTYWQTMIDGSVSSLDDLAQKSKDHQKFMADNKDIKGNVEGMQSLDRDLIRMDGTLVDMHGDFKQMLIIQQKNEAEKATKESISGNQNGEREAQRKRNAAEFKRQMKVDSPTTQTTRYIISHEDCVKKFGEMNCADTK